MISLPLISFAEQEQIRQTAEQILVERGDGVFTLREIYERIAAGADHDTATRLHHKHYIIDVIRQIHQLVPVCYDRKSGRPLIWAQSHAIPQPLSLRRSETTRPTRLASPQGYASCNLRYRQMMLGVLLLDPEATHDLWLDDGSQPSRHVIYLRCDDDDNATQTYLVWYDESQQMLYGLHEFYSSVGVSIYNRLHLRVLEQPATLRVTITERDDEGLATDLAAAHAAQQGDEQPDSRTDFREPSVSLTQAMQARLDLVYHRVDELQRRLAQLRGKEAE